MFHIEKISNKHVVSANEACEEKNYDIAIADYEKALPHLNSIEKLMVRMQIGAIYYEIKSFSLAIKTYEDVLNGICLNEEWKRHASLELGKCYAATKQFANAIQHYKAALNEGHEKENALIHYYLGVAHYLRVKQSQNSMSNEFNYSKSIPSFEKALSFLSGYKLTEAYLYCAHAYFYPANSSALINAEKNFFGDIKASELKKVNIQKLEKAIEYYKKAMDSHKIFPCPVMTEQEKNVAHIHCAEAYMRLASFHKGGPIQKARYDEEVVLNYTQAIEGGFKQAYAYRAAFYSASAISQGPAWLNAINDYTKVICFTHEDLHHCHDQEIKKQKTQDLIVFYKARGDLYYQKNDNQNALADYIHAIALDAYSVPRFVSAMTILEKEMGGNVFVDYFFKVLLSLNQDKQNVFFNHCLVADSGECSHTKKYYSDLRKFLAKNAILCKKIKKTANRNAEKKQKDHISFFCSKKPYTENAIFYAQLDDDDYDPADHPLVKKIEKASRTKLLR